MASQLPVTMPPRVGARLLGWLYSARGWTNLALILNWLGWMALLSGLAVYTDRCNSTERENDHSGRESTMKALLGTESCANSYALNWWAVSLMFILLVVATFNHFFPTPIVHKCASQFLVLAMALLMVTANTNRELIQGLRGAESAIQNDSLEKECSQIGGSIACDQYETAISRAQDAKIGQQVALAGTVVCLISNFILTVMSNLEDCAAASGTAAHAAVQPPPLDKLPDPDKLPSHWGPPPPPPSSGGSPPRKSLPRHPSRHHTYPSMIEARATGAGALPPSSIPAPPPGFSPSRPPRPNSLLPVMTERAASAPTLLSQPMSLPASPTPLSPATTSASPAGSTVVSPVGVPMPMPLRMPASAEPSMQSVASEPSGLAEESSEATIPPLRVTFGQGSPQKASPRPKTPRAPPPS